MTNEPVSGVYLVDVRGVYLAEVDLKGVVKGNLGDKELVSDLVFSYSSVFKISTNDQQSVPMLRQSKS